jgi:hypothetical protein
VVLPYLNAIDLTRRPQNIWIIDFPVSMNQDDAARFEAPFAYVTETVLPLRRVHRESVQARFWWRLARPCPEMKEAVRGRSRFLITPTVSKYRLFVWTRAPVNCDHQLVVFVRSDDYFFGVLQSRLHEVWGLNQGTRLETRPRYTPTTCFETFPFPFPDDLAPPVAEQSPRPEQLPEPDRSYAENLAAKNYYLGKEDPPLYGAGARTPEEHRAVIAAAAKELNELRERWLNPPEWTVERVLEFPGSVNGPWARYVVTPNTDGIGTVRYPRLEPRDAECAAKVKKRTLTNLYNERPAWLDLAHQKLDAAVAAAYGWPDDLSDEPVLERLLALNLERAKLEAAAKPAKPKRTSREKVADEMI